MEKIIYKIGDGVAVITPNGGDIHKIARKDVPSGAKYKVVDAATIPTDRTFRNAWEVDESTLTDGTGEQLAV